MLLYQDFLNLVLEHESYFLTDKYSLTDHLTDHLTDKCRTEKIIITNHENCITLGRNSNIDEVIKKTSLPIIKTNRGGGATYHDPGQIIVYPFINLKARGMNLSDYINILHNWIIAAFLRCGVALYRNNMPGLWLKCESAELVKVAFMGLRVKNGFVYHGIAINLITCSILNFEYIIPCRDSSVIIGKCNLTWKQILSEVIKENPFDGSYVEMI